MTRFVLTAGSSSVTGGHLILQGSSSKIANRTGTQIMPLFITYAAVRPVQSHNISMANKTTLEFCINIIACRIDNYLAQNINLYNKLLNILIPLSSLNNINYCNRVIDVGSEWRTFSNEKSGTDPSRVGGPENPLLNGSDLSTVIGPGRGDASFDDFGVSKYQNRRTV